MVGVPGHDSLWVCHIFASLAEEALVVLFWTTFSGLYPSVWGTHFENRNSVFLWSKEQACLPAIRRFGFFRFSVPLLESNPLCTQVSPHGPVRTGP